MANKKSGKSVPSRVPPLPPGPARPDGHATEFQPNPLEVFWEKHHKLVYTGLIVALVFWGGHYLYTYRQARQASAKWGEIFQGSGLFAEVPPFAGPFQMLENADPDRLAGLTKQHAGEPIAPWLEFLGARKASFTEEPETVEGLLQGIQKRHPRAEVSISKVPFAYHQEPMPMLEALRTEIEENRKARTTHPFLFSNPDPDPALVATVATDRGAIKIRFFPQEAPRQVFNFCELARDGYFDGLKVHKVSQGGDEWTPLFFEFGDPLTKDPEAKVEDWGTGGSEKTVPLQKSRLFHFKGAVTAVRSLGDKRTARGQVRILGADHHRFDGLLVVFGQVVEGMDVVESIARDSELRSSGRGAKEGIPLDPPTIQKVTLEGDLGLVLPEPATQPATQPTTRPATQPAPDSPGN